MMNGVGTFGVRLFWLLSLRDDVKGRIKSGHTCRWRRSCIHGGIVVERDRERGIKRERVQF